MEPTTREGPWNETVSGRQLFLLDPRPEDIDIHDIAVALSNLCRFGGHVDYFWSVAAHSLLVAQLLPGPLKLAGLLHDAAEAYVVDIPRPLKLLLPQYVEIEHRIEAAIGAKFGVEFSDPAIKQADNIALMTERRDVRFTDSGFPWKIDAQAASFHVVPVSIQITRRAFLAEFNNLAVRS